MPFQGDTDIAGEVGSSARQGASAGMVLQRGWAGGMDALFHVIAPPLANFSLMVRWSRQQGNGLENRPKTVATCRALPPCRQGRGGDGDALAWGLLF